VGLSRTWELRLEISENCYKAPLYSV
jgi:hypothetical protein